MNKTIQTRVKHKRDTAANWENNNPVLLNGEVVIVDTASGEVRMKTGDGTKTFSQLPFDDESLISKFDAKLDDKLDSLSYEYNKDIIGSSTNTKLCIGGFNVYDTNITVNISMTSGDITYNATLVVAASNYSVNAAAVYGDPTNILTAMLTVTTSDTTDDTSTNYRKTWIYANFPSYAKALIHIKVGGNTGNGTNIDPTNICEWVDSIPTENIITLRNMHMTADNGFIGGLNASATTGGAVGKSASATTGFAGGQNAYTTDGAALGYGARATGSGGSIGRYSSSSSGGGAVGSNAYAYTGGGAIGSGTISGMGFSGGRGAKAGSNGSGGYIDTIQLGTGTNNNAKTLQVYNYTLMNSDGTIPENRMPSAMLWRGDISSLGQLPSSPKAGEWCRVTVDITTADSNLSLYDIPYNAGDVIFWNGEKWMRLITSSEIDNILSTPYIQWGGDISDISEFPVSIDDGALFNITADISNGYKISGKVSEIFGITSSNELQTISIDVPDICKSYQSDSNTNYMVTVYDESGVRLGQLNNYVDSSATVYTLESFGISSIDDTMTFYLGMYDEDFVSSSNDHFPDSIKTLFNEGDAIFWTGASNSSSKLKQVSNFYTKKDIDNKVGTVSIELSELKKKSIPSTTKSAYPFSINDALAKLKKKSIPSTTKSAYPFSINDALANEKTINYKLYGNSYQATRSGKNLLPYPYTSTTTTINGITFTDNGDGSVTVNGTATSTTTWFFYQVMTNLIPGLKTGDTITLSIDCDKTWTTTTATMNVVCNYYNSIPSMRDGKCVVNSSSKYETTVIGDDWVGMGVYVVVYNGQTIDNITLRPQIELGSTATSYEQYGISPSPDYPSEILSVGDLTKNLCPNDWEAGFISASNGTNQGSLECVRTKDYFTFDISKNYYISSDDIDTSTTISWYFYDENKNFISRVVSYKNRTIGTSGCSVTIPTNTVFFRLVVLTTDINIKVQIEEGSTATEYEPYHKYDVPVTVCGKNLFDLSIHNVLTRYDGVVITSNYLTIDGDLLYVKYDYYNGGAWLTPATQYKLEAGTYTLSGKCKNTASSKVYCGMRWSDDTKNSALTQLSKYDRVWYSFSYTFTISETKTVKGVYFQNNGTTSVSGICFTNIQLEKNATATAYEPYFMETTHIYLDEPLRKVGDYADYIDFENQKILRNINKISLYGTESWRLQGTNENGIISFSCRISSDESTKTTSVNALSTHFIYKSYGLNDVSEQSFFVQRSANGTNVYVRMLSSEIADVTVLKDWLSNNNVAIYYILATPIEESITVPELTVPDSYDTNIMLDTSIKPSVIDVEYFQDINKIVTNLTT